MFENDLRRGDGDELRKKFRAVHSSAALAVNCFAPFKDAPIDVVLLGKKGAERLEFERPLPIFRGGIPPNIDVWIERDSDIVAVESKLLEYLTPKQPTFSDAYERLRPPQSESCWWRVYQQAKREGPQLLDRAQVVKHYLGLNEFRRKNSQSPRPTLVYIFWEPQNRHDVDECNQHRDELETFADAVSDSQILFRWTTYSDLWEEWANYSHLLARTQCLWTRYQVRI